MTRMETTTPPGVDLATCDREPIHIPGSIQPFGLLLVLDEPSWAVVQASGNTREHLGLEVEEVLGKPLGDLFGEARGGSLREGLRNLSLEKNPFYIGTVAARGRGGGPGPAFHAVAHRMDGVLILELEPAPTDGPVSFQNLYPLVRTFLAHLERVATVDELGRLSAAEVRRITGFDRVLIYRFDEDGHGTVIAEDRNEALPSYLDHRFPASDIPAQARELYRLNRLRIIADADYTPVPLVPPLHPTTGRPLDLTYSSLRSVSPVHVAYMKNMGTGASMSISILRDDRLWGLISCHHRTPRGVPFEVRTACDFLGQMLSLQLDAQEHHADFEHRMRLKSVQAKLLASMANEDNFVDGLVKDSAELLDFAAAGGAAVLFNGQCLLLGTTPDEPDVHRLADWLSEQARQDVYSTDSLASVFPEAESYKDRASGLLAISISKLYRSYVLWFRPEFVRTVKWGGDPTKPIGPEDGHHGPHPRKSFETWKETVRLRSLPWRQGELDTAVELRNSIVGIVLRKAEELAQLSAELKRSNRELEAFSYSVSHDLRAPFRHIVGYSELLLEESGLSEQGRRFANTIIESARFAGSLVDNLLAFSQMGRTAIRPVPIGMNALVEEVRARRHAGGGRPAGRLGGGGPARCPLRPADDAAGVAQPAVERREVHEEPRPRR